MKVYSCFEYIGMKLRSKFWEVDLLFLKYRLCTKSVLVFYVNVMQ
jgi:hypothetical protein